MLRKNAAQSIHVYAYDYTTGAAKTGDALNITGRVSLDGTSNAIDDTNPTEVDATNMPGVYAFDLTAAETNCDSFALYAKSSTSNIRLEPIIGFTTGATGWLTNAQVADSLLTSTKFGMNAITAAVLDTGAASEIASAVRTNLATELARVDATISSRSTSDATNAAQLAIAAAIAALNNFDPTSDEVIANVTKWLGTACATPSTAGVPEVDVTHVGGSDTSAAASVDANVVSINGNTVPVNNLEDACDGTGYNLGGGSVVAASVTAAVTTDAASRSASQADTSALGTLTGQAAIAAAVAGADAKLDIVDGLVDRMIPMLVGNVSGAGTDEEVYTYGGVTVTVTFLDANGNTDSVVFS